MTPALHPGLGRLLDRAAAPARAMAWLRQAGGGWRALEARLDELDLCRAGWYEPLVSPLDLGRPLAGRLAALAVSPRNAVEPGPESAFRAWPAASPEAVEPAAERQVESRRPDRRQVAAVLERYAPRWAEPGTAPRAVSPVWPPPAAPGEGPQPDTPGEGPQPDTPRQEETAFRSAAPELSREAARRRFRELTQRVEAPRAAGRPVAPDPGPAANVESFLEAVGRGEPGAGTWPDHGLKAVPPDEAVGLGEPGAGTWPDHGLEAVPPDAPAGRGEPGWMALLERSVVRAEQAAGGREARPALAEEYPAYRRQRPGEWPEGGGELPPRPSWPEPPGTLRRPSALARFAASAQPPGGGGPEGGPEGAPGAPGAPPAAGTDLPFSVARPGAAFPDDAELARRLAQILRREASRHGIEPGDAEP